MTSVERSLNRLAASRSKCRPFSACLLPECSSIRVPGWGRRAEPRGYRPGGALCRLRKGSVVTRGDGVVIRGLVTGKDSLQLFSKQIVSHYFHFPSCASQCKVSPVPMSFMHENQPHKMNINRRTSHVSHACGYHEIELGLISTMQLYYYKLELENISHNFPTSDSYNTQRVDVISGV